MLLSGVKTTLVAYNTCTIKLKPIMKRVIPYMAEYIFFFIAILAGLHALTFARWLRFSGNKTGAYGVWAIIAISLTLPLYRLMTAP